MFASLSAADQHMEGETVFGKSAGCGGVHLLEVAP